MCGKPSSARRERTVYIRWTCILPQRRSFRWCLPPRRSGRRRTKWRRRRKSAASHGRTLVIEKIGHNVIDSRSSAANASGPSTNRRLKLLSGLGRIISMLECDVHSSGRIQAWKAKLLQSVLSANAAETLDCRALVSNHSMLPSPAMSITSRAGPSMSARRRYRSPAKPGVAPRPFSCHPACNRLRHLRVPAANCISIG